MMEFCPSLFNLPFYIDRSSPLWVPERIDASRQAEKRWESRDSWKPWDSGTAGTIERAVRGNRRRQKMTESRECQSPGATVAS